MHMTDILGFRKKPFSARKPDAAALIYGLRSYSHIDGMASVFRAPGGIYVSVHLQNLPTRRTGMLTLNIADKIQLPILCEKDFAYLAFYTDIFNFHDILCLDVEIRINAGTPCEFSASQSETIARGTILK